MQISHKVKKLKAKNMKKEFTHKRFKNRLVFLFAALFGAFVLTGAYGQTIVIDSEPTGPLYVGDTIEVEYTATGFDANAVFYLVFEDGAQDTVLASSALTNDIFEVVVPAGFNSPADINVYGVVGDPYGPEEFKPLFGELSLAGTTASYDIFSYNDDNYSLYFSDPGIRRMQLPTLDLAVDSVMLGFDYRYANWPDTLELVIEYSIDGGGTFAQVDTISFINYNWNYYETGLPGAALTSSTILRVRQANSSINNSIYSYGFYINTPTVTFGEFPVIENIQALTNSPFALSLPLASITSIAGPANTPYSGNAYAGDSILIEATTSNFTADTKFEIVFNNSANLDDPVQHLRDITATSTETSPGVFDWSFEAKLPANMSYNNWQYFWVVPYKGTTYEHGTSISHDFSSDGASDHTILGESTIDGTYGIYFTAENIRSVETAELNIGTEGMLYVELARREDVFSPDNTDIIVEYSVDGGTTFTEIGSVELNQMSVYTDGTSTFEMAIPAGAVSDETIFRCRQDYINSGNLDQFYLKSYSIMLNSNRFVDGYTANLNWDNQYVRDPEIVFEQIELPEELIFPGTELTLEYTVIVGEFPANTPIRALMTNHNPNLVLGELAVQEAGSLIINVPPIDGGIYSLQLVAMSPMADIYSSTRSITVEEVNLEILSVAGNPERTNNGNPYYFTGDEITVDYNIVGEAMHGVELQIEDDNGDFVTIATDNPADGQVVATIPTDIELPGSPQIRLALSDSLYNTSTTQIYYTNGYDFPNKASDSMIVSSEGKVNPNNFPSYGQRATFGNSGPRSFETKPFKINNHGRLYVYFIIPDSYYNWEGKVDKVAPIYTQYSTDMGATWTTIDEIDPLAYNTPNGYQWVYRSSTLPYEAISDQTKFRVIQNEDGALGFGENVWTFYYIRVRSGAQVEIYSDNTMTLTLEQATISLGTLAKTTYGPGEALTIPYNVVGNFPADVGFATIMQNNAGERFLIETSDATGSVQLAANMPVNIPETAENGDEYDLYVWPYQKTVSVTEPVFGYMEDFDDDNADVIAYEGGSRQTWGYYMYDSGQRSVLTKALPQLEGDSVYFDFALYIDDNPLPSEGVFVEVTYDGGTTFVKLDTITEYRPDYTIALATADMTDQTHLRWIQYLNNDFNDYAWQLWDMMYRSEESNIITNGWVSNNQPIANVEIDYPDFPAEFAITNMQEDIVYSGESFDLEVTLEEGFSPLPATAEYLFYLADQSNNVLYDQDGNMIMLGSMTGTGTTTLTIPSSVFKDEYRIVATIQVDDPDADDPYVYYEEQYAIGLDVYNPLLKTIATTKEAYRGDEITVGWELQTGSINTADYYFHLRVNNEILYTQKDAPVNFVENLPTDISLGNRYVTIFATTDSIYKEGDTEELDQNAEWPVQENMQVYEYNYIYFYQRPQQNRLASNFFDMTEGGKVTFEINYGTTGNDFLESNHILFEYSDDGGATYTEVDAFPNDDYELGDGYQMQTFYFAKGMLSDSTRFRFRRQNGNYGSANVRNFYLTQWSNEAPLEFVSDQVSVMSQEVNLGLLPATVCPGSSFSIDYQINGVFGEKVVHYLQYSRDGGGYSWLSDSEVYGVTEGSGSIDITIPQDFSAGDYKFRIYSYDATTDITRDVESLATENSLYFVPAINFTGTSLSGDQSLCQEGISTYYLYSTQPYFIYQARDVATGELYGDPVSNENGGTQTLRTDTITEDIELEIVVTAMAPDMSTSCATGVLDRRIEFALVPDRKLFMNDGGNWTAATDMQICEGNPLGFGLETGYYDKNGYQSSGITSIIWYRDDINTAVSSDYELYQFNQSGSYFAEVIVDGCNYITNAVQVDVLDVPEQPTFTASGDLTFCEGTSIQLTADMDYPYYRWYGGYWGNDQMSGSSQSIEIVSDGSYNLQVSNLPFEVGCASPMSEPIQVNVIEEPNTYIYRSSGGTQIEDNMYASCGGDVYLRVNSYPQTYSWTLDGETFLSSANSNTLKATQTGWYNVRSIGQQNGVTCSFNTPDSIFVQISDELPKPTLTLTGDDEFCSENGSALLSTDAGYDGYRWLRNGSSGSVTSANVVSQNSVYVEEEGTYFYSVRIADTLGCESETSNEIEVTVLAQPDRTASVYALDNSLCGAQEAEIVVSDHVNNNRILVYQLVNMATGELAGTAASRTQADGGDFVLLNAGVVTEVTEFGVMVSDLNASGCEVMIDDTEVIEVNTAEIVVMGNQLWATPGAQSYQWYRNGTPLMGSTSDHIQVFDAAEYTVTVMYGFDCILTSGSASMKNVTGISNILANDNITLYPNPTRDKVQIEFANNFAGDILIEVTNIAGQVIHNQQISKHNQFMNTTIDMEQFQQGVYFFNFITEEHKIVKSVVKQ